MLIYFFRCSYNPYDGPNEHPEAELPLVAGKYLYVYGTMDEDGFYEGLTCLGISSFVLYTTRMPTFCCLFLRRAAGRTAGTRPIQLCGVCRR